MERDRSLDLGKGLAILFVYLGHSILYHPIQMADMYPWCHNLSNVILSFNMPMFFLISGYLFSMTRKTTGELYKGKTLRILVPYLTTMVIVAGMKLLLPSDMAYNKAVTGGVKSLIVNWLLYGGDGWFAYVLFLIFVFVIPFRNFLKDRRVDMILMTVLIAIYYFNFMPKVLSLNKVFHFMVFFVAGFTLSTYYTKIKEWALKYWWMMYAVFLLANVAFVMPLSKISFVFRFILPFTGTLGVMTLAFQLERLNENNKVVRYIEYCGKYSLQFYLFTFCYPIIRTVIVSVLHVSNPFAILGSVFVLQLICITVIVEITRRIKWLKIPMGY